VNRRILAILSFGHLATDLAQGALPVLLPGFKATFHLSYAGVGFLVLMASISSSVIQPVFGFLSDRVRIHWVMPLGALLSGLGMALTVHAPAYGLMVAFLLMSGLGVAAFHPEGYRFAGLAAGDRRTTGMAYFSVGGNIGYGFGPAVATVALSLAGANGMSYLPAFSALAAILLLRAMTARQRTQLHLAWEATDHPIIARPIGRAAVRSQPMTIVTLLVLFVTVRSWVQIGVATFTPLYSASIRHFDPRFAGLLVSTFLGAGAVGTLLGGFAADRWGRRRLLIYSMVILPIVLSVLMRASGAWAVLAAGIGGMSLVSTFAIVMVMAQDVIPDRIGMISGLLIGFGVGMGGVGATLLGVVADRWGLRTAMDVLALLPVVSLAIALGLPSDRTAGHSTPTSVTPEGEPAVSRSSSRD